MPNPYLVRLRNQHDELRTSIDSVQKKALDENRDLTSDELRSITDDVAKLQALTAQIEQLANAEQHSRSASEQADRLETLTRETGDEQQQNRARNAGEMAARLAEGDTEGENLAGEHHRSRSRTTTRDRDPGHYRSVKDGGQNSFFGDHYRSKVLGDAEATKRLEEHMRAVTQASGGTGIIPPKWLTEEYESIARQVRVVANMVRHIPLGDDPRPLVLPKQTGGTDQNIVPQAAEGANTPAWGVDRFTTNHDTLTPHTEAAYQDVARQLLGSSTPAVDMLIMGDLRAAWDTKVENIVCAAILAGGTAAGTTFATEAAFATDAAAIDGVIDGQMAVSGDQRGPADLVIANFRRFGAFRKLKDGNSRPLMPVSRYNPQNAAGAVGNVLMGDIEGSDVVGTAGVPTAYPEKYAVLRRHAVILGESDLLDFTYEQVGGPAFVRMGIWGYVGVLVRNPNSVSVQTVTAA
ncbi:phage major capsid protein [Amycolatopsis sp. YIM 10]|uniref:phage major capsid protein n=1 Tax=Amycolatopsis sp. YIM 10 TaxID=2653857 RepID=UPI0012905975|nr:phage major capsid protein [Amycolatopsis sp. YIM 10]QFU87875.1 Phage capsid family protein [Amycolatopsis sp. YIM 10]QFU94812.1 Phage capsid family protein [Amycolatopsis sp. YIM 10]